MLVSVIIPVYKVEAYLPRAVESVLSQTMADFELWLVDDGSPDGCGRLCDAYARQDARVRVIHQTNQGAPAARNAAIERSSGKYRYFCDADDYMEPNLLKRLTDVAEKNQAELVVCGYAIETDTRSGVHSQTTYPASAVYETAKAFRQAATPLFDKNLLYPPWNKLYLAQRMDARGIRFPSTFWDDFPFNLAYLRDVERVALVEDVLYHFTRSRAESETARYVPQMYAKREEEDGWMRELYAYWGLNSREDTEFLARRYAERLVGCVENLTNPRCTLPRRERLAQMNAMLSKDRVREALSLARPATMLLRLMLLPLRLGLVWLCYGEGLVISLCKTHAAGLFSRLKAGRGRARA